MQYKIYHSIFDDDHCLKYQTNHFTHLSIQQQAHSQAKQNLKAMNKVVIV